MKKRIITAAVAILVSVIAVLYFLPSFHQKEVLILSPIMHAAQELHSADEWERWNPGLKKYCIENPGACVVSANQAQGIFTIKYPENSITVVSNGAVFDVTQTGSRGDASCNYALVSSRHNDSTTLIVTEKRSLLLSLLSLTPKSIAMADADSLKTFIETPSAYYGFPLEITGIVDTLVVAITKRVPTVNRVTEQKGMYSTLYSAIQDNHLTITKPIIAHYHPAGKDSVDITSAIPVANKVSNGNIQNNISFMEMPPKGKMVVGYFKGKYADRTKLYNAMDRYIVDKSLKKIAAAYEEYLNNQVPGNDSSLVEIKICSPVL